MTLTSGQQRLLEELSQVSEEDEAVGARWVARLVGEIDAGTEEVLRAACATRDALDALASNEASGYEDALRTYSAAQEEARRLERVRDDLLRQIETVAMYEAEPAAWPAEIRRKYPALRQGGIA